MLAVLLTLRTVIAMGVGLLVWYVYVLSFGAPTTFVGVLIPVWLGGLAGGVVCSVFSLSQGVSMAFVSGVLLALGFLWVRHGLWDLSLGPDTMVSLWPVWFPAAYYVGAVVYPMVLRALTRRDVP